MDQQSVKRNRIEHFPKDLNPNIKAEDAAPPAPKKDTMYFLPVLWVGIMLMPIQRRILLFSFDADPDPDPKSALNSVLWIQCIFDPWIRDPGWVKSPDPG